MGYATDDTDAGDSGANHRFAPISSLDFVLGANGR
jgi:hypothetical protein